MGQNRFQRGPKGSKCGQKRVNLYQNALNWVPSGLKWRQHPLKWVKTGSSGVQHGPKGSKWPQNGLKYPKMAFSRPNLPKSSPERVHPALQDGCSVELGPLSGGYSSSVHDFCPKVYIGYSLPYVHRVPPPLCTWVFTTTQA